MTETPLRVLCVDDNADLNDLITHLIDSEPDVTLLDLTIPGRNVLSELPVLAKQLQTRIIVFSAHNDPSLIEQALNAGAAGFVCKHMATEELVDAIRNVHSGKTVNPAQLR